jgi:hypothetical protein
MRYACSSFLPFPFWWSSHNPISARWNPHVATVVQSALVIIDDFHFVAMTIAPDKTDPPLIVDPDRVLTITVAAQCFQLISGRRRQNAQLRSCVKLEQLS